MHIGNPYYRCRSSEGQCTGCDGCEVVRFGVSSGHNRASRSEKEELTRVEQIPPVKGGSRPFAGEDKQVNFVNGQYAWDQPGSAPVPQVALADERQLQIWLTPHGFLKAAMENQAAAKKGTSGTVVSFTSGKFKVTGTIDAQNMVARTETWLPNPVLGDMLVETTFSSYED